MIDVVFFLLVFFMMASLAMTIYQGLPVNLPEAASGQRNAAETASITLSRDGGSFLNSEPITVQGGKFFDNYWTVGPTVEISLPKRFAIGALVPFNFFQRRAETMGETIERYGSRLELVLAEAPAARREAA